MLINELFESISCLMLILLQNYFIILFVYIAYARNAKQALFSERELCLNISYV